MQLRLVNYLIKRRRNLMDINEIEKTINSYNDKIEHLWRSL